jgi:hypothetical protein
MNIITPQLKEIYKSFIDELLRSNSLSLPCKLIYGSSSITPCPNCIIDPISSKSSNNYNSPSGPIPFADGQICPYCRGLGGTYSEANEIVDMLVVFDYKYWVGFDSTVHKPEGMIQTISKLQDLPKLNSCNKIIVDTNIINYTEAYFQRNSEPQPAGFGESSYLFTFWKKI